MILCNTQDCENIVEGRTQHCASCNSRIRKIAKQRIADGLKREALLSKQKPVYKKPKKVGTTNTWACTSGKRVTQTEINRFREGAYNYQALSRPVTTCDGCG